MVILLVILVCMC